VQETSAAAARLDGADASVSNGNCYREHQNVATATNDVYSDFSSDEFEVVDYSEV